MNYFLLFDPRTCVGNSKLRYNTVLAMCHFSINCVDVNYFVNIDLNRLLDICISKKSIKQRKKMLEINEKYTKYCPRDSCSSSDGYVAKTVLYYIPFDVVANN